MLELIIAAKELAEVQSHSLQCRFKGCTCDASVAQVMAVSKFWRQYRLWEDLNGKMDAPSGAVS
jgi:hypothetical protein